MLYISFKEKQQIFFTNLFIPPDSPSVVKKLTKIFATVITFY